jgi:hypothetical protein
MKFRVIKVITILIFSFNILRFTNAQVVTCSTVVDSAQIKFENNIIDSITTLIPLNRTFNITVYVVKYSGSDQTGVNPNDINQYIAEVNQAFEPIKVTFQIGSYDTIDNYQLDYIRQAVNEKDLTSRYFQQNTINLYLVSQLTDKTNKTTCAYTYYPSARKDMIFMAKNCVSGVLLIEQLGHFFNLYHTHETAFGLELVNESNCSTAGDLCCDTYAQPDLSDKVTDCKYSSSVKDPNNQLYQPSVKNYMSAAPQDCRCFFSKEQYIRMLNAMVLFKNYLW